MNVTFQSANKSVELNEVVDALNVKMMEHDKKSFPILTENGPYRTVSAEVGRKYIKLVVSTVGQRSVYCFLDKNGNIFKAATWKAPAKHIRGTVFDDNYSWGKALGPYGAAYLR